jgi:Ethanolamine utilization protein EutJ (predicted chaperonin)
VSAFTATTSKVNLRNSIIINNGAGGTTGISIAAGASVASTQDNINVGSATPGAPNGTITKQ